MYLGHVQLSPASRSTATKGNNMYVCSHQSHSKAVRLITCELCGKHTTSKSVSGLYGHWQPHTQKLKGQLTRVPVFAYTCVCLEPTMLAVAHYLSQFHSQYDIWFTCFTIEWHENKTVCSMFMQHERGLMLTWSAVIQDELLCHPLFTVA